VKQLNRVAAVMVFVCSLLVGATAHADKKSDAAAKKFYEDGTKYYSLGDFTRAIENYKKAFELKPDAVFLYNIAQAYRLSNDFNQALFFYKSFLRNMPTAPNKAEVEKRIAEMEEALEKQRRTANAAPTGPVAPDNAPTDDTGDTGDATDTTDTSGVPDPADAADASAAGQENGTPPSSGNVDTGGSGKKPIYKKWWFWAGIGAVAVGTVAIVVVSSSGGGGAPSGDFGSTDVF